MKKLTRKYAGLAVLTALLAISKAENVKGVKSVAADGLKTSR